MSDYKGKNVILGEYADKKRRPRHTPAVTTRTALRFSQRGHAPLTMDELLSTDSKGQRAWRCVVIASGLHTRTVLLPTSLLGLPKSDAFADRLSLFKMSRDKLVETEILSGLGRLSFDSRWSWSGLSGRVHREQAITGLWIEREMLFGPTYLQAEGIDELDLSVDLTLATLERLSKSPERSQSITD